MQNLLDRHKLQTLGAMVISLASESLLTVWPFTGLSVVILAGSMAFAGPLRTDLACNGVSRQRCFLVVWPRRTKSLLTVWLLEGLSVAFPACSTAFLGLLDASLQAYGSRDEDPSL